MLKKVLYLVVSTIILSYSNLLGQCTPSADNNGPLCIGQDLKLTTTGLSNNYAGSSLTFDGSSNNYIEASGFSGILGTNARTIEAWVKTTTANNGVIISWGATSSGNGWRIRINSTSTSGRVVGALRADLAGGNIVGSTPINDGEWHHIAVTFENDGTPNLQDILLYVDGQLETYSFNSTSVTLNTLSGQDVRIGQFSNGNYFTGEIDEVRIWDKALLASEILDWMNKEVLNAGNCVHPSYGNLVAYWLMNDGSPSTTIADSAGNNTATLVNGVSWNSSSDAPIGACYDWSGPGGFSSIEQDPVRSGVSISDSGDYTLIARTTGCTSVGQITNVTIAPGSPPSKVTASSPSTYCDGEAIADLTATANTSGNPANLRWYTDEGLTILEGTGSPFTPTPIVGSTKAYYVVESNGVCQSDTAVSVDLTVHESPADLSIAGDSILCIGDSLVLTSDSIISSGSGIILDGTGDYLAIDNFNYNSTGLTELTVETWVKTAFGSNQIIASFDRSDYWRLEVNGSGGGTGQIGFDLLTNAGILDFGSSSRVDDGEWHHVAAVFDNGQVNIYIDGTLDNSTSQGATYGSGTTRFGFIGTGSEANSYNGTTGPNYYFNGELDEFRVWSVALNESTINNWKSKTVSNEHPNYGSLDLHYAFDENAGTIAQDSKNSNNAAFIGNINWVERSKAFGDSIAWSGPNSFFTNSNNATIDSVLLINAGVYTISAHNNQGCSKSKNVNVSVSASPLDVTATSPSAYCLGETITDLTATANTSGEPDSLKWFDSPVLDNQVGTGSPFTPTVTAGTRSTYYVVETMGNCVSQNPTQVDVVLHDIPNKPTASDNGPLCIQQDLELTGANVFSSQSGIILDGAGDYIAIENFSYSSSNYEELTVETWLKTNTGTDQVIASFDRNEYWRFEINGDGGGTGQVGFDIRTDAGQLDFGSSSRVDDGEWHHVAAIFSHGTVSIYIDGQLDNSTSLGNTFGTSNTRFGFLGVGSEAATFDANKGPTSYFNGELDEFRIWHEALDLNTIRNWMTAEVNAIHPNYESLQIYYQLNENVGTSTNDNKNNNDGQFRDNTDWVANSLAFQDSTLWTGPNAFTSSSLDTTIINVNSTHSGDYILRVANTLGCEMSDTVSVIINSSHETRATGNWSDTLSWVCNIVPDSTDNVVIMSDHSVTVDIASTADSLTIEGIISLNNGVELNLEGNLDINGTFTPNDGTLRLSGSSAQTIDHPGTLSFNTLILDNGNGITLNTGNYQIDSVLEIRSGTLYTNNSLTIMSNASHTGRVVAHSTSVDIDGDVTVQRYVDGDAGYRYLACPIEGKTFQDWEDDFYIAGYGQQYGYSSIYYVDETRPGVSDSGWIAPTSNVSTIDYKKGYAAYFYESQLPATIDVIGDVNFSNVDFDLTYTNTGDVNEDGWNFVNNPYPSTLDWDAPSGKSQTNLNDAIYIWRPDIEAYATYISGIGLNGGSRYIETGQSFFVKTNAASPSLTIGPEVTVPNSTFFFKNTPEIPQALRIRIENTTSSDEAAIVLSQYATDEFDGNKDAYKLLSTNKQVPQIYTTIDSTTRLSVNSLNSKVNSHEIPLYVKSPDSIFNTLHFTFEEISHHSCIDLKDNTLDSVISLNENSSYTYFSLDDTTENNRFVIYINKAEAKFNTSADTFYLTDGAAEVELTNLSSSGQSYLWRFGDGNISSSESDFTHIYHQSGVFEVQLISNSYCGINDTTSKIITILDTSYVGASILNQSAFSLSPNPARNKMFVINNNPNSFKNLEVIVYNSKGQIVLQESSKEIKKQINIEALPAGIYSIRLSAEEYNEAYKFTKL